MASACPLAFGSKDMRLITKTLRIVSTLASKAASNLEPPLPAPPEEPQIIPSEKELAYKRWITDDGDRTHRLNYDLKPSDIVIDLGGYRGQWSSDIYSRYLCKVHIFEPVTEYAESIQSRYKMNPDIMVYNYALGARSGEIQVYLSDDATSSFKDSGEVLTASVVAFNNWIEEHKIHEVALLKINIEGAEYDLLDHLIATGIIKKIRNIQVQFHDFVPDSTLRVHQIQHGLQKYHKLTYKYPFIWENWEKLDSNTSNDEKAS